MNFATFAVGAVVAALLVLAIRRLIKKGACSACKTENCSGESGCCGCPHSGTCQPK